MVILVVVGRSWCLSPLCTMLLVSLVFCSFNVLSICYKIYTVLPGVRYVHQLRTQVRGVHDLQPPANLETTTWNSLLQQVMNQHNKPFVCTGSWCSKLLWIDTGHLLQHADTLWFRYPFVVLLVQRKGCLFSMTSWRSHSVKDYMSMNRTCGFGGGAIRPSVSF